ncbi:hypothetical protein [Paraburkholderia dioscoreae]|uniref:Uncharacterized protein n=1 Tax=Paraburkholderia dioscoreae TaxID=2604047 RepID=A0A5Q4ZL46_9BURK|nr:hypothetical protein [Paraburkholderia dioscoreae]VVD31058.1 conserved protein of unknown function [Paraburkholderia dioscoreae]
MKKRSLRGGWKIAVIVTAIAVCGCLLLAVLWTRSPQSGVPPADAPISGSVDKLDAQIGSPAEHPDIRQLDQMHLFAAVDEVLAALPKAPMAFNTPPPMNIDAAAAKVELRVGPRQSPAELVKSITAPGEVQVHEVQIANRMKASLFGDPEGLTITPLSPASQLVSRTTPSIWVWSVKPRKAGQYRVHVELEAEVKIDGEDTPRLIDVFDGTIAVTITGPQRVEHFAKDNWQWLWTALLVPAGGWWWKRREKKPEDTKPDDGPKIILPK